MNWLHAKVYVFLIVVCVTLYGINEVLQTYQFEESKNNELQQQPSKTNEPDFWNDWSNPMDKPFHNHGKDVGDETARMNP